MNQTAAKKKRGPLQDKFAVADALVTVRPQYKMHGRVWSVIVMRVFKTYASVFMHTEVKRQGFKMRHMSPFQC